MAVIFRKRDVKVCRNQHHSHGWYHTYFEYRCYSSIGPWTPLCTPRAKSVPLPPKHGIQTAMPPMYLDDFFGPAWVMKQKLRRNGKRRLKRLKTWKFEENGDLERTKTWKERRMEVEGWSYVKARMEDCKRWWRTEERKGPHQLFFLWRNCSVLISFLTKSKNNEHQFSRLVKSTHLFWYWRSSLVQPPSSWFCWFTVD